ncbi:MAG: transposase, partial [Candidatus Xenobia bacterium]
FEILADRGFDDAAFLSHVADQGFSFVIRVCKNNSVRQEGQAAFIPLGDFLIERDRVYDLGEVDFTAAHRFRTRLVIVHDKDQKDAWFLSTNMPTPSGRAIVHRYGRRFEIEESFKDLKDMRAGLHLGQVTLEKPERLARLLVVAVLAYLFLVSAGLYGEKHNLQRRFQANTRKQRVLAVWRLGLRILRRMSLAIEDFLLLLSEAPLAFEVQS